MLKVCGACRTAAPSTAGATAAVAPPAAPSTAGATAAAAPPAGPETAAFARFRR